MQPIAQMVTSLLEEYWPSSFPIMEYFPGQELFYTSNNPLGGFLHGYEGCVFSLGKDNAQARTQQTGEHARVPHQGQRYQDALHALNSSLELAASEQFDPQHNDAHRLLFYQGIAGAHTIHCWMDEASRSHPDHRLPPGHRYFIDMFRHSAQVNLPIFTHVRDTLLQISATFGMAATIEDVKKAITPLRDAQGPNTRTLQQPPVTGQSNDMEVA